MANRIERGLSLLAAALLALPAFAGGKFAVGVDEGTGSVEFVAIGNPTAIRIRGSAEKPKGKLIIDGAGVSGSISVGVASFDTGLSLRNQHMRDKYLESSKFPDVTLTVTKLGSADKLASDAAFSGTDLDFEGVMKIHGVEKPVKGKATVKRKGDSVTVSGNVKLGIKDFNIEIPSFAGVTVANEVDIKVEFTAPMRAQ